jgi:hypothetical protein
MGGLDFSSPLWFQFINLKDTNEQVVNFFNHVCMHLGIGLKEEITHM